MSLPDAHCTDQQLAARLTEPENLLPAEPVASITAVRDSGNKTCQPAKKLIIRLADAEDRKAIYRIRHEVYARELGQHSVNAAGQLTDPLDEFNTYLVVVAGKTVVGFVSITPPGCGRYSIDKYFERGQLPFPVDDQLYEVRLLTVPQEARRWLLALALMYASFRWTESHGGTRIMAIGRVEILSMYHRVGLKDAGLTIQSGAVTYRLLQTTMPDVHASLPGIRTMLDRIEADLDWQLGIEYDTPAPCYHGGQFFAALGEEFETLERLESIISADVLDAWFPPSPRVVETMEQHLPWLLKTSPPTGSDGLRRVIARVRGVAAACVLPGAGSSDLIFLALRHWLNRKSRVLTIDPSYGEYAHVLERVIGCRVDHLTLRRDEGYRLDLSLLESRFQENFDLVILVNPNNPTGQYLPRQELEPVLRRMSNTTRVWIDETYVEYAGEGHSLETFAARSENIIICKSMSKVYALSGARVAYLCANPYQLETLRALTPPWAVSLPAQVAAVAALQDPDYYAARYAETRLLQQQLVELLQPFGWDTVAGVGNFVLCHLPASGPEAQPLVARCCERGLFLRNAGTISAIFGDRTIRIAVKDASTNQRMIHILAEVITKNL